jgi:hypothetical protein
MWHHAHLLTFMFAVHCLPATGLGKGLEKVFNTDDLVNEEDLTEALQQPTPTKGRRGRGQQGKAAATPEKQAASELLGHADSLSARERNKLKRKAKAMERQGSLRQDSKSRVRQLGALLGLMCA